jgi:adenylate cyclase, class 2
MSNSDQELEVKFYLSNLQGLENRLQALGAQLVQPRVHETNLRFDTSSGDLSRASQVLRLRQDTEARITYKGPGRLQNGVKARRELECTVGDLAIAQTILEALGYQVWVMYEKYRTTYALNDVLVTLDEMPYGNFTEIEGPHGESIRATAELLGLNWDACILDSYMGLFDHARMALDFTFRDLSFVNFASLSVTAHDLGVTLGNL